MNVFSHFLGNLFTKKLLVASILIGAVPTISNGQIIFDDTIDKTIEVNFDKNVYSKCLLENQRNASNSEKLVREACRIKAIPKKCRSETTNFMTNGCIAICAKANFFSRTVGECSY